MVFKPPSLDGYDSGHERFGSRHAALRSSIATALACTADLDATDIVVTIIDGTVLLEGTAASDGDMERALAVATAIAGPGVLNRMWRKRH